jgi:transcriptional regulator with XRE-family HTH domain
MSDFARFLSDVLRERGWSQTEAAEALGVSQTHISRLLSDKEAPGRKTIAALARVLPWDEQDLWARAGYGPRPLGSKSGLRLLSRLNGLPEEVREACLESFHSQVDMAVRFAYGKRSAPDTSHTTSAPED